VNIFDIFSKNNQVSNLMKIRPLGTEQFPRTDRRTDMKKLIVPFRNFVTRLNRCFRTVHIACPTNPVFFISHLATGDV